MLLKLKMTLGEDNAQIIMNIAPAKVHLNKFREYAEPFQHFPQNMKPIVIAKGASPAVMMPCITLPIL